MLTPHSSGPSEALKADILEKGFWEFGKHAKGLTP